jgi:3-methyl-2-oxobutanoate hydroxymethyltransferase
MKINALKTFKQRSEKITCLTAYDASFASVFDQCGVDIVLVGDSLGNVIKGGENTLGVSMKDMLSALAFSKILCASSSLLPCTL